MKKRIVQLACALVRLLTHKHDQAARDAALTTNSRNLLGRAASTPDIRTSPSQRAGSTRSGVSDRRHLRAEQPTKEQASVIMKRWPPSPLSVGRSRRFLADHLETWGLAHLTDAAELIVSELVTNAVTHAYPPYGHLIATRFEHIDGGVRIEVHDANDRKPEPREASPEAESGRGPALVDALTLGNWGVSNREGSGKVVWAECVSPSGRHAGAPRD